MPLDTLAVPPEGEHDPAELGRWSAVELFSERARAADPAFALRDDNAAAVAKICRRLDGLPLALELAAARIRIGGPAMVLGLIERGIDSLGAGARDLPERQRGLRAALDWTVSLKIGGSSGCVTTAAVPSRPRSRMRGPVSARRPGPMWIV